MFDAGLRAFSLTVLFLVFSVQWQQCVSIAEDFPSDASSAGDDFISYNQQSLSTENALLGDNFDDLDNYDQDGSEKENENDTFDEEIDPIINGKTERKPFKEIEDQVVYGDTDGDVIVKKFNSGRWENDQKESIDTSTIVSTTTTTTTSTTPSTTSTLMPVANESTDDSDEDEDELRAPRKRPNDYKDWLTTRKRRAHSAFEKYKAYHRNYRRYGHKGHKKAFGRYKKYEHHRSKHKNSQLHHHQHQHRNHFHYTAFNDNPYYQGQVSYYGQDDDTMDDADTGFIVADKPFHLPAKMRSYQHYGQYRRGKGGDGSVANSYRPDKYPNRSVKWPHLRRIEYQITKDERREWDPDEEEVQLPPYIRKYNRRNKQLLNLLEGTMAPTTTTTVLPVVPAMVQYSEYEASGGKKETSKKHDGVGHKSGRSHFHNHRNPKWIMEDLFEEQRANPNNPNIDEDQYLNDPAMPSQSPKSAEAKGNGHGGYKNSFKEKDFSDEDEDSDENHSRANEDENLILIGKNELPSGSVVNNSLDPGKKSFSGIEKASQIVSSHHSQGPSDAWPSVPKQAAAPAPAFIASPTEILKISPKANQFIYHRVASPRSVGTGTNIIGVDGGARKQRLPFVAITDRRLETSKMQKQPADFRQNHLPLP